MWVRSQKKYRLVDIKGCYIFSCNSSRKNHPDYEYRIVGYMCESSIEGNMWLLGAYKTEEKAMKVLDELQYRIARSESGVFQMPEED